VNFNGSKKPAATCFVGASGNRWRGVFQETVFSSTARHLAASLRLPPSACGSISGVTSAAGDNLVALADAVAGISARGSLKIVQLRAQRFSSGSGAIAACGLYGFADLLPDMAGHGFLNSENRRDDISAPRLARRCAPSR